jgi:hypothetical protein
LLGERLHVPGPTPPRCTSGSIPPWCFHEDGYRGHARGLLQGFSLGVYIGVGDLQEAGMTAMPRDAERLGMAAYPQISRWVRP